jgi:hypothetical protein
MPKICYSGVLNISSINFVMHEPGLNCCELLLILHIDYIFVCSMNGIFPISGHFIHFNYYILPSFNFCRKNSKNTHQITSREKALTHASQFIYVNITNHGFFIIVLTVQLAGENFLYLCTTPYYACAIYLFLIFFIYYTVHTNPK